LFKYLTLPQSFFADPAPVLRIRFDADPDPTFQVDADPDSDADLDPTLIFTEFSKYIFSEKFFVQKRRKSGYKNVCFQ
jgi:hypothetical protein